MFKVNNTKFLIQLNCKSITIQVFTPSKGTNLFKSKKKINRSKVFLVSLLVDFEQI